MDCERSLSEDRCGEVDGMDNFDIWRCEVMDALTSSNLKDALRLEKKPNEILKKDRDKINRTTCGIIKSFLTKDLKYNVMNRTSIGEDVGNHRE